MLLVCAPDSERKFGTHSKHRLLRRKYGFVIDRDKDITRLQARQVRGAAAVNVGRDPERASISCVATE